LHRSLKQNTDLEKMLATMTCSQAEHIFALMVAQVKLGSLKIATRQNRYTLKQQTLIESLKSVWQYVQEFKQWITEKNQFSRF